jgi:hypothetical protein
MTARVKPAEQKTYLFSAHEGKQERGPLTRAGLFLKSGSGCGKRLLQRDHLRRQSLRSTLQAQKVNSGSYGF